MSGLEPSHACVKRHKMTHWVIVSKAREARVELGQPLSHEKAGPSMAIKYEVRNPSSWFDLKQFNGPVSKLLVCLIWSNFPWNKMWICSCKFQAGIETTRMILHVDDTWYMFLLTQKPYVMDKLSQNVWNFSCSFVAVLIQPNCLPKQPTIKHWDTVGSLAAHFSAQGHPASCKKKWKKNIELKWNHCQEPRRYTSKLL